MSAAQDLDPEDLSLPELPGEVGISSGPTIDSSDEFPLPSFGDEDEGISADILFPVDEPTAEELPVAKARKPESATKLARPGTTPKAAQAGGKLARPGTTPKPAAPVAKAKPSTPTPAKPAAPAAKASPPAKPVTPAAKAKPVAPAKTAAPAAKAQPVAPAKPAVPAAKAQPAVPAKTAAPAAKAQPAVPAKPAVPAAKAKPTVPAKPAVQAGKNLDLPETDLPNFGETQQIELPPFPAEGESLDTDYFEAGLEKESKEKVELPKAPAPPQVQKAPEPAKKVNVQVPSIPSIAMNPDEFPSEAPLFTASDKPENKFTQPGPPQASLKEKSDPDDLFLERSDSKAKKPEEKAEPVSREDWAEQVPVEQYVRKVQVKRRAKGEGPKVRAWIGVVGVLAIGASYFLSPPIFSSMNASTVPEPYLVVGSNPKAEVYAGESLLGETPLSLTAEEAAREDLQIKKSGYETVVIPAKVAAKGEFDKVHTFSRPLQVSPVKLSWKGLPAGSVLWWNGEKVLLESLSSVKPGSYSVKVKAPDRPAVSTKVEVAPRDSSAGPLDLAATVQAEFAKQPKATVSFKAPDEKTKGKAVSMTVKSLDPKKPFSQTVKGKIGEKSSVVLPSSGKYKISFEGNETFKSVSQTFEAESSQDKAVEIAMAKQPPRAVAQPSSRPSYQQPTYRPTYRPRPRPYYPSGGGGGGGGRIAPPAF